MRVCYHVETHTRPAQVEHLVRVLHAGAPRSWIVVSHDRRAAPLSPGLGRLPRVVVRRDEGGYGDLHHVTRWLTTARWLAQRAEPYDWLVNLSGQCYPLRPVPTIEDELESAAATGVDAFLESVEVGSTESAWPNRVARDRYHFRHRRLAPSSPGRGRLARWVSAASHVQPLVRVSTATGPTLAIRHGLPAELRDGRLRGGSFFGAFGPRAVSRVLGTASRRPALMDWFAGVVSPAEVFFQTVLEEFGDLALVRENRRFADFTQRTGNHAAVLDQDSLARALNSGADFARKFDEARFPGLVARVDAAVHGGAHYLESPREYLVLPGGSDERTDFSAKRA